jgi:hypothetical protein
MTRLHHTPVPLLKKLKILVEIILKKNSFVVYYSRCIVP